MKFFIKSVTIKYKFLWHVLIQIINIQNFKLANAQFQSTDKYQTETSNQSYDIQYSFTEAGVKNFWATKDWKDVDKILQAGWNTL